MGSPKALLQLDGEALVQRGIRLLTESGCDPVLVVVGAGAEQVAPLCAGAETVHAADWDTGMGASLRAGLGALAGRAQACVVALVDQPLVTVETVRRLLAAPGPAAVASYQGRPRNPVRLDADIWPAVAQAAVGDEGARGWLRAHPDQVHHVDCTGTGSPDDLDTPADLVRLTSGRHEPVPTIPEVAAR